MFDFGTVNTHAHSMRYGDLERLDLSGSYSLAFKLLVPSGNTNSYNNGFIISKTDVISSNHHGWFIRHSLATGSTYDIQMQHGDGTAAQDDTYLTSGLDDTDNLEVLTHDETHSIVLRFNADTDISLMQADGFPDNRETGQDKLIDVNTKELSFGRSSDDGATGLGCLLGQVMIWPGYILTDEERDQYHAGVVVPGAANLSFWDKCIVDPGIDQIFGDAGTNSGSVTLTGNDVDGMFSGQGLLLPHRQLAGYNIRILSQAPEVYKISVPQEYAALSLGDEVLISDGNLPSASSLLGSLNEHFMLDDWRSMNAVILEASIQPNGDLNLVVFNRMPAMSLFWQTAALDTGNLVNSNEDGTALLIPWAAQTNDRNSQHFIIDATEETTHVRLASIGRFSAKTNHRGTLYEVGVENLVTNSAFLDDGAGPPVFVDYVEEFGTGGTIETADITDIPMLFKDTIIQGKTVRAAKLTLGSAGQVHLAQLLVINGSGDSTRVAIWHRGGIGHFSVTRSDTGDYWSSGSTWVGGTTWHDLPSSQEEWTRTIFYLEGMPTTGTISIFMGIKPGVLENGIIYLGQTMVYQHWAILSDIVTYGGATETSEVDDEIWDLDNGGTHDAQTFNPNRGTVRVRIHFTTDSADIPNSTFCAITEFGESTTNYDRFFIERNAGGTLKLSAQRMRTSADGYATMVIAAFSAGDEIEVAYRWTDETGDELGLSARTLSIFHEGVKGTDDQSTTIHSITDQTTFIRWGNSAGITVFIPFTIGYIKNIELVQRAIPDEEILARRVSA